MMSTWAIKEEGSVKAFDFMTEDGSKKMDYTLFSKLMKLFFTFSEKDHPVNLGLC